MEIVKLTNRGFIVSTENGLNHCKDIIEVIDAVRFEFDVPIPPPVPPKEEVKTPTNTEGVDL